MDTPAADESPARFVERGVGLRRLSERPLQTLAHVTVVGAVVAAVITRLRGDSRDKQEDPPQGEGDRQLHQRLPATELDKDRPRLRDQFKRFVLGRELVLSPSHIGLIEEPSPERIGVCCSGGGIRSAAFNLGALQTLQRFAILQKAKYLAAVSGGSYIAAAFAMVAKTGPPESDDSDPSLMTEDKPPFFRGSPEEQYLRNRSSYMAPGGGGRLRLLLRLALGLAVNLALLAAALFLLAWALAMIYRLLYPGLEEEPGRATAHASGLWWQIPGGLAAAGLVLGLVGMFLSPRWDHASKAFETISLWLLGAALLVVAVDKGLPELIAWLRNRNVAATPSGAPHVVAPAVGGTFAGLLGAVALELRTKTTVRAVDAGITKFQKLSARVQRAIGQVAVWVLGPFLLIALLVFWVQLFVSTDHISWIPVLAVADLFIAAWVLADVTTWSLHPFYRRRLNTAFALKRVAGRHPIGEAAERSYNNAVSLGRSGLQPNANASPRGPTLLVCAAANISDAGITPPGRSVTSFTFSSGSIGGPLVGGISTQQYEQHIAPKHRGKYSLVAAVAMSGAAISPSMGKETRPSFRFLLGLANVRLGVWVPNPRRIKSWEREKYPSLLKGDNASGEATDRRVTPLSVADGAVDPNRVRRGFWFPRPGPHYLIKEMLGWNTINDRYLYVTDGGHYDNLGLVELLRRGCTEIYCFDASGGTSLSSLGDAIALARSELEVEITGFDPKHLREDKDRLAKRSCALGKIVYPNGLSGVLVYVPTVVTPSAPQDVQTFRMHDSAFPHHSTFDQLYTDQKFEAYRELGAHACEEAIEAVKAQS
jgi:hypothetical protein